MMDTPDNYIEEGRARQAFLKAIGSGKTDSLERHIQQNRFPLNGIIWTAIGRRPAVSALSFAIKKASPPVVSLLLNYGADLQNKMDEAIRKAFNLMRRKRDENERRKVLELLVCRTGQWRGRLPIHSRRLRRYALLCEAILKCDEACVTEVLAAGDYASYAEILDVPGEDLTYQPLELVGYPYEGRIAKAFLRAGITVPAELYFAAVCHGDIELLQLGVADNKFDPLKDRCFDKTVLHEACKSNNLEIIEYLVNRCGLNFNIEDSGRATPFFYIRDVEFMRKVLAALPEMRVDQNGMYNCKHVAVLMEHSPEPGVFCQTSTMLHIYEDNVQSPLFVPNHHCESRGMTKESYCNTIRSYVQKLWMIDSDYAESKFSKLLRIHFKSNDDFHLEIVKMKSLRISQSTSFAPGRSLFDFIFLIPNEAARFSKNQVVLQMYLEHQKDFRNLLPHYGFTINYQLRRGEVRRVRLEAAHEFLCSALGTGLPQDITEKVFGFCSNKTLECFNLEIGNK